MNLFDDLIEAFHGHVQGWNQDLPVSLRGGTLWMESRGPCLILSGDTAVELGNPNLGSVSLLLWTENEDLVTDGAFALNGSELSHHEGESLPFAKTVLLQVEGFDEENCYQRHRELSLHHLGLQLSGYMVRASTTHQNEWSRVSRGAIRNRASFSQLARSLRRHYLELPYVKAAQIAISTRPEDIRPLQQIAAPAFERIAAMTKMAEEMPFDCESCDYTEVCQDVAALRDMHRKSNARRSAP